MPILELSFASKEDSLSVRHFAVREAISELFEVTVVARSPHDEIDLESIVGQGAGFALNSGVVHLTATDASYEWFVRLRGAGIALLDTGTILDTDDHHPRAEASGTASDLLLALMGRIETDKLAIVGDPRLIASLRAG